MAAVGASTVSVVRYKPGIARRKELVKRRAKQAMTWARLSFFFDAAKRALSVNLGFAWRWLGGKRIGRWNAAAPPLHFFITSSSAVQLPSQMVSIASRTERNTAYRGTRYSVVGNYDIARC